MDKDSQGLLLMTNQGIW
ncbi:MAG: hypothetical protein ACLUEJ_07135 [Clostridium sp.]